MYLILKSLFELLMEKPVHMMVGVLILFLLLLAFVFAASTVYLRIRNSRKRERWDRLESEWEPELLEILSGAMGPRTLWKRVRRSDELYFIDFLFRYARRLHGEEKEVLAELARPFLKQVAARTYSSDPERRARAVQTLSHLGLPTYERQVIRALDDPSPLVAMSAARSLSQREHAEYWQHVLDRLDRFEHWSAPFLSSMFAAVGNEIAPHLRRLFADIQRPDWVRSVAAEALRELNDLESAEDAARILEHEANRSIFTSALRLLGRVGNRRQLSRLRVLCNSPEFLVRLHAISALVNIGETEDLPRFLEAFNDPSPWIALRAAWGLKENGGGSILEELIAQHHPRADLAQQVLRETIA